MGLKKKAYRGRIFYGWFIVIAGMSMMASIVGIVFNGASIFTIPICSDLGYSRASVSANQSIVSGCIMIFSFAAGKIFAKFDAKRIIEVCSVTVCICFFCYSLVSALWLFYLISLILGFAYAAIATVSVPIIIGNWFYEKSGLASGLTFMGSGLGSMVFNSVTGYLLEQVGWRSTYQILAGIVFVMSVPGIFMIIYTRPEDIGLKPYGNPPPLSERTAVQSGVTLHDVKTNPCFLMLCFCAMVLGVTSGSALLNLVPHLSDSGYTYTTATLMSSVCMGALAVGKFVSGKLFDKFSARLIYIAAFLAVLLGLIGMIFCKFSPMLVFIALSAALASSYTTVGYPFLTRELFGRKDYITLLGIFYAFNYMGVIIMPVFNGYFYDITGSYNISLMIQIGVALLSLVMLAFIFPKNRFLKKENE